MLTHIIQWKDASIFLIDEPDIYLHAELQRQLLGLLRNLGPDILLATHSTEIITEADAEEIVLISKDRFSARRLRNPADVEGIFEILGSNINPILTQLAKTRRVLFVEGKDFHILSRFALRLSARGVANRRDFAVVPVEGFNPERIRSLKAGMETTLGGSVLAGAIFDRDYRSAEECAAVQADCETFCEFVVVHNRKEIENFLLVPAALDRALEQRLEDRSRRGGAPASFEPLAQSVLDEFAASKKSYVAGQLSSAARQYSRGAAPQKHETSVMERAYEEVEAAWATFEGRVALIPGKDALADFNRRAQETYGSSVTPTAVIAAMPLDQVPREVRDLIESIRQFSTTALQ
jgi:energy-coupling factor transporter ATP-binding protein EcfA2